MWGIDRSIERGKSGSQGWWGLRGETQVERLQPRPQDSRVDLGEEERGAPAVGRQGRALLMVEAFEQALPTENPVHVATIDVRVFSGYASWR